jgi:hypothetical protein
MHPCQITKKILFDKLQNTTTHQQFVKAYKTQFDIKNYRKKSQTNQPNNALSDCSF